MIVGIIGAGLAGLVAGKKLVQAGHEVVVFEKSRGFGGRLSTRYFDKEKGPYFDHGSPYLKAEDPRYQAFIDDLAEKGVLREWSDSLHYYDGNQLLQTNPHIARKMAYCAPGGMNTIGKHLSRWVDMRLNTKAIGFTYIGKKRRTKSAWTINLESSDVFEVDAIIVATPAVQAYGLIETSTDETMFKNIIKDIDTVFYDPKMSLMLGYEGGKMPDFKGINCVNDERISWIGNESSKRDTGNMLALTVHSTGTFAKNHLFNKTPDEEVQAEMVSSLRHIVGDWSAKYDASQIHLWRYSQPKNYFKQPFVELGVQRAPIALVGDYMGGQSLERAFLSGYELGEHWAKQLSSIVAT